MPDLRDIADSVASTSENRSGMSTQLNNIAKSVDDMSRTMEQFMMMLAGSRPSQANYRTFFNDNYRNGYGYQGRGYGNTDPNMLRNQGMDSFRFNRRQFRNTQDGFIDGLEDALLDGIVDSDFRRRVTASFQNLADALDTNIQNIPNELGKRIGQQILKTNTGQRVQSALSGAINQSTDILLNHGQAFVAELTSETGTLQSALGAFSGMGTELASVGAGLAAIAPEILAVIGAMEALDFAFDQLSLTVEAVQKMWEAAKKVGDRENNSRKENVQLAKKRMEADYQVLVEQPFELLKQAVQSLYNSWNQNLTTVAATQGYDKADVQDLMSVFAQRLRDEGLSSYISGADMFDNLAKVIQSGMSGKIAEEFAYQATVLGKAIPTQDFFSYASTYASVAANAVRAGQSQSDAIQTANKSLQSFANGLLYASRELTGGFTTGLQNASSLYEESAKIAQAARSDNLSSITGTLLAVQGYVGAIAPDLASSLTSKLYEILTGGNSADVVALRSLANINASNTEFLQAFASNPQRIFATMFDNLSKMYSDSTDAYMEKAEGYAQLFGLSSEAFQRIDFKDLAEAIRNMDMSSTSLNANMELLKAGQTTTTAEQLKAQQINQYMIDEGLAYVIDNEAAQLIQQHMWDEQLAREIMEAQYSVDLTGSAMEALEMITRAVSNVVNLLNPLAWGKKIGNVIATATESTAMKADVAQVLELGKVGSGNKRDFLNLTTVNRDLNLTRSLVDLLGGTSMYGVASTSTKLFNQFTSPVYGITDAATSGIQAAISEGITSQISGFNSPSTREIGSQYSWGSVGKSAAAAANALLRASSQSKLSAIESDVKTPSGTSASSASAQMIQNALDKMLDESYLVDEFVKQGKSYEDWAQTAGKFGISDLSSALATAGYNETDVKGYFQDKETEQGVDELHNIRVEEKTFRDTGIKFWTEDFPNDYRDPLFEDTATMIANQATMILNQEAMIENQNTMITNQELMIERLDSIITHQEDWHSYFKDDWTPDWSALFTKTTLTDGWEAYFKKGWVELEKNGWSKFYGATNDASFDRFYGEFMKYFIEHTYYSQTEGYRYSDVEAVKAEKNKNDRGDAIYALAEMLTKNLVDLQDPQVQTNTLLSQILIVVNAIKNQNDEVSTGTSGSSLAESLSALALGLTTSTD